MGSLEIPLPSPRRSKAAPLDAGTPLASKAVKSGIESPGSFEFWVRETAPPQEQNLFYDAQID